MGDALPFVVGTLLALGALSVVLLPLLSSGDTDSARARAAKPRAVKKSANNEEGLAVEALREIEFDRATGKLSDIDYEELRTKYTALALADLRKQDDAAATSQPAAGVAPVGVAPVGALAAGVSAPVNLELDPVEAAVQAAQARRPKCGQCGPRPESDSVYCSNCGGYLPGCCGSCGADVTLPGARFCNSCGGALAAA